MRRRLDLAISLIARPELLFLDEPTTGLDPRSRDQLWSAVKGLADDGVTVLLTTQYLAEAEQLADRVAVLHQGRDRRRGHRRRAQVRASAPAACDEVFLALTAAADGTAPATSARNDHGSLHACDAAAHRSRR